MKIVIDTSLWIAMLRDTSGKVVACVDAEWRGHIVLMVQPVRLELLQGCKGEAEWGDMLARLDAFDLVPMTQATWDNAARMYFDLRRVGKTIRSTLDCCIAQICLEQGTLLLHDDRDFEIISTLKPLNQRRLDLG